MESTYKITFEFALVSQRDDDIGEFELVEARRRIYARMLDAAIALTNPTRDDTGAVSATVQQK